MIYQTLVPIHEETEPTMVRMLHGKHLHRGVLGDALRLPDSDLVLADQVWVAAHGKVHKISGHARGRNVNVSWFGVTRTPEEIGRASCRERVCQYV